MAESVNDIKVTDQMIKEAERIENNGELMLALVDLIFMGREDRKDLPS